MSFRGRRAPVAALALVVIVLASTRAHAESYETPPGDRAPTWSPDAEWIAFLTERAGGGVKVVAARGRPESWIVHGRVDTYALSSDWSVIAYQRGHDLVVAELDRSSAPRALATTEQPTGAAWAPGTRRLAFTGSDGGLYVLDLTTEEAAHRVAEGFDPAWSPDGSRIAYIAGRRDAAAGLHVVNADGRFDRNLTPDDPRAMWSPAWSTDGTRLAYGAAWKFRYLNVIDPFTAIVEHSRIVAGGSFAWAVRGRAIAYTGVADNATALLELDVDTGRERRLLGPVPEEQYVVDSWPAYAPDGVRLAFAGGRECRDRVGVYVRSGEGAATRVSGDCRITGTQRDDVMTGTVFADVLVGLAGDDTLAAVSSVYPGDSLRGGPGDDVLVGVSGRDVLEGGPGDDRLFGGRSGDALYGGPGRDRIVGQGGGDVVYARDGRRDVISCGPNGLDESARDEAFVDRIDVVAEDCEIVHRPR